MPQQAAEERELKTNIAIAALFAAGAFLTPAHATPVLFTATTTLPAANNYPSPLSLALSDSAGTITATGYHDMFPTTPSSGTAIAPSSGATEDGLTVQNGHGTTIPGLGVNDPDADSTDAGYIAPTDAVVLDFAGVHPTANNGTGTGSINQITFNLYEDYSGADYEIYGLVSGTVNTASAVWALVKSGVMQDSKPLTVSTTSLYTYYALGVTDCALDIESVGVQYSGTGNQQTPEPGTFVMAGMALLAVGVSLKKRNRKA